MTPSLPGSRGPRTNTASLATAHQVCANQKPRSPIWSRAGTGLKDPSSGDLQELFLELTDDVKIMKMHFNFALKMLLLSELMNK